MQEVECGKGVSDVAVEVGACDYVATGVVHVKRRCFTVHRAVGAFCTSVFNNPNDMLRSVRNFFSSDKVPQCRMDCVWVDLQGCAVEHGRELLSLLFPDMQPSQMEAVLAPDACDVVELQPALGQYVVGSLACSPARRGSFFAPAAAGLQLGEEEGDVVTCSFACSERFLVTVHAAPFVGLAEVLRHVRVGGGASSQLGAPIRAAEILSTLVCFSCEGYLPDPTLLLCEVSSIDEMGLLISLDRQDQTDLLRRVALLRRRISDFRSSLFMKERLLQDLTGPTMRTSFFLAKSLGTVPIYRETLEKITQVSERLDDARDMLNQANLNFVTGVSMKLEQASTGLEFEMTLLNQVAIISLPINLITSIFGMNCKVPFLSDQYDSLVPFWCICGGFVAWAFLCMLPLIRQAIRGTRSDPIVSYD